MTESAIFVVAVKLHSPAARAAYLDEACGDNSDLRRQVEELLRLHDQSRNPLDLPADLPEQTRDHVSASDFVRPRLAEDIGTVIGGRYKLLEQIGEGGMGTVWIAEQMQPVRRKVALKLIKAGMDSKAVLTRFEAERQALALMDHPNIAKVLDGGTTETRRPYFVMEYVKGIPFTTYCDDCRLSVAERLALFVPVCQAVQHAHQKGIIHRDLKPSNILICLYDGKPVPKVIDFGLAKAIHQTLTERTLHTAHGQMLGTPLYMSPEQAEFNNLDVDTRTDIYALGVILYELLTGTTPLEKQRFQAAAWHEMLRLIKEEEPPRPSARLSGSGTLPSLAAQRQLEPIKLTKLVRGELDWIVMKCLEKDRGRRYDTATGLARDVERYLADEVVEARPPTAGYRLWKFMRKHRAMLTTAAAFALLLTAAAAVSGLLAAKARRAEATAQEKRHEAEVNAEDAKENAKEAKENLEWSRANERALGETYNELEKSNITNLIQILGLQVDLALTEARTDPRISLLRLAHPLKDTWDFNQYGPNSHGESHARIRSDYPPLRELREFVTAAVLAAGQNFALLLPPITHDGQPVNFAWLSPDNRTLLTLGEDDTARLWEARTFRPIAVLRQGNERVEWCGFSPDGKTVFTDDQTSVARLWDVPSGRFRAATEARKNRYEARDTPGVAITLSDFCQIGASRLLTKRSVAKKSKGLSLVEGEPIGTFSLDWQGPVELWDTATGRLVGRLDGPGRANEKFRFINEGRWVSTLGDDGSVLLIFSAEDGRPLARLNHPGGEIVHLVTVGPAGQRVATVSGKRDGNSPLPFQATGPFSLRFWDAETWREQPITTPLGIAWLDELRFVVDDASQGSRTLVAVGRNSFGHGDSLWSVYRYGQNEPVIQVPKADASLPALFAHRGDQAHAGDGQVYDVRTCQRLLPPLGRRFHPDLARFSPDGRFVSAFANNQSVVIDTRTDKLFPCAGVWHTMPGFGLLTNLSPDSIGALDNRTFQLLPPADRLNGLSPELLELWAQVAVRGHLDDRGALVKWDEAAWEKKRQELAAKPAPWPDFPFPGHVAQDKLHWLRQEYEYASDADKPRLAKRLLDRAEAAGDKAEAVRWREIVTPKATPTKP